MASFWGSIGRPGDRRRGHGIGSAVNLAARDGLRALQPECQAFDIAAGGAVALGIKIEHRCRVMSVSRMAREKGR